MSQKKGRKLPQILNEAEQEAILKVPNVKVPTGLRNRTMLGFMLYAGLRVSEIIGKERKEPAEGGLRLDHVELETGKLKIVNAKGHVDRNLWLNDDELELFKRWLKIRPKADHDLVFCTLKGGRINNRYIRAMIERIGIRAGISRRVYPHLLRHSCLTDLYKDTKDIRMVQKIAGHSNLSTTEIYTHIYDADVEKAMKNLRRRKAGGSYC